MDGREGAAAGAAGSATAGAGAASTGSLAFVVLGMSLFWQWLRHTNVASLFVECRLGQLDAPASLWAMLYYAAVLVGACVAFWLRKTDRAALGPAGLCLLSAAVLAVSAVVRAVAVPAGVVFALQTASALACAWLFLSLLVVWGGICTGLARVSGRSAVLCVLGSSFASIVMSFLLYDIVPFKGFFPMLAPFASSVFGAIALSTRVAGGLSPACGDAACVAPRPNEAPAAECAARFLPVALALFLAVSVCAKGLCDVAYAGSLPTGTYAKSFITIAELSCMMLLCVLGTARVERFMYGGWIILVGGLTVGIAVTCAAALFSGSDLAMQVGTGTVAAARTSAEAFAFLACVVFATSGADRFARRAVPFFVVPGALACLAGYGIAGLWLEWGWDADLVSLSVPAVLIALNTTFLFCSLALLSVVLLRGFDAARGKPAAPEFAAGGPESRLVADAASEPPSAGGLARQFETCGLTPKECEVARYLLKGYSIKRIAEVEVISLNTVQSHARNLYRKLGIHSRQELIDLAERSGK